MAVEHRVILIEGDLQADVGAVGQNFVIGGRVRGRTEVERVEQARARGSVENARILVDRDVAEAVGVARRRPGRRPTRRARERGEVRGRVVERGLHEFVRALLEEPERVLIVGGVEDRNAADAQGAAGRHHLKRTRGLAERFVPDVEVVGLAEKQQLLARTVKGDGIRSARDARVVGHLEALLTRDGIGLPDAVGIADAVDVGRDDRIGRDRPIRRTAHEQRGDERQPARQTHVHEHPHLLTLKSRRPRLSTRRNRYSPQDRKSRYKPVSLSLRSSLMAGFEASVGCLKSRPSDSFRRKAVFSGLWRRFRPWATGGPTVPDAAESPLAMGVSCGWGSFRRRAAGVSGGATRPEIAMPLDVCGDLGSHQVPPRGIAGADA